MATILASSSRGVVSACRAISQPACGGDARLVQMLAAPPRASSSSSSSSSPRIAAVPHRRDFSSLSSLVSTSSTARILSTNSRSGAAAMHTAVPRATAAAASTSYSGSDAAAETIAPITIYTAADGKAVQFQDLWDQKNGMAVVVFLRHFGCPFCWQFAGQLRDAKPSLDAAGVKLITIGVGVPEKAQLMAEKVNFPIECLYCDDDRQAYRALELIGDARTFFFPKTSPIPKLKSSFAAIRGVLSNGYKVSSPDDKKGVMQQGGLYVFKGQEVLYARREEHVADHPDLGEVLGVCCTIPEYA